MGLPEFTPVKNYKFLPGDPEKMFKRARERSRLNIYACKKLNPVPVGFNAFLVLEGGVIHATAREMSHVFAAGVNNLAERVYKFLDMC